MPSRPFNGLNEAFNRPLGDLGLALVQFASTISKLQK